MGLNVLASPAPEWRDFTAVMGANFFGFWMPVPFEGIAQLDFDSPSFEFPQRSSEHDRLQLRGRLCTLVHRLIPCRMRGGFTRSLCPTGALPAWEATMTYRADDTRYDTMKYRQPASPG